MPLAGFLKKKVMKINEANLSLSWPASLSDLECRHLQNRSSKRILNFDQWNHHTRWWFSARPGRIASDANGKIPDDFEAEVKESVDNIGAVLKSAGMSPADVVSVQVYLTDKATFQRMNSVDRSYFQDPRPTRTTVVVAGLLGPGRIDITATARK